MKAVLLWLLVARVLWCSLSVAAVTPQQLDAMLRTDPQQLCGQIECASSSSCPAGTRWMENIAMSGCCGACVRFLQDTEDICTGKVEEKPCILGEDEVPADEHYGTCDEAVPATRSRRYHTSLLAGSLSVPADGLSVPADGLSVPADGLSVPADGLSVPADGLSLAADGTMVIDSAWCDYGMYCTSDYCTTAKEWITCQNTQEAYDRDSSSGEYVHYRDDYRWRPECSADGRYSAVQCKGSIQDNTKACLCVDPDGNTLPGKAFSFQEEVYDDMNCLCSRRVYDLQQEGEEHITLHCSENGNYESLQCDDGWCYCVFPENGTMWGYQMPQDNINYLPCFNRTLVGDQYTRQCESMAQAHSTFISVMEAKGIKRGPSSSVACSYDGSYAPEQCEGSSCTCFSKYGRDCITTFGDGCKCLRDMLTYAEYGESYSQLGCVELHGNYAPETEWPDLQVGFNVDEDGIRTSALMRFDCILEFVQSSNLNSCQDLGDECMNTCNDGTDSCPEEAYFYSPNYEESATCFNEAD